MTLLSLPPSLLCSLSDVVEGLVSMCVEIHQSVARKSLQYKAELSRHNYVTPTRCVWCVCACVSMCTVCACVHVCVCVCVCVRTSTHVQCQPRERHSCFSMPVMCTLYQTTPTTSVLYSFTKSVHCSKHMGHVLTIEWHRTVHQH